MTNSVLYEEDFYRWTQDTAELIRQGRWDALDRENLAEEIESLGRSDRRELSSRLEVLIMHLLKWSMQPEYRCGSWKATIGEQRDRIGRLLEDSPSLRPRLAEFIAREYCYARRKAVEEMELIRDPFPAECPFTTEQILERWFLPDREEGEEKK